MVDGANKGTYVAKKIKVLTPEEEKNQQNQPPQAEPASEDDEVQIKKLIEQIKGLAGTMKKDAF